MAKSKFKWHRITTWGGLNEDENPHALADGELSSCLNVYRRGDTVGARPGLEHEDSGDDYDARNADPAEIQGLEEVRKAQDGTRFLICITDVSGTGEVKRAKGTVQTQDGAVQITSGQNNVWTFAQHAGKVYMAGGAATDTFNSWDLEAGNNVAHVPILDNASAAMFPKYVIEYNNFLHVNGFEGTAVDNNPMMARYSALNDGDTWPIENNYGGQSAIGGFDSFGHTFSTGFGRYVDNEGDWLLYLTNKRIFPVRFTGDSAKPFVIDSGIQNGCVHQRAFVSLGLDSGDAIYISEHGIHSLRQSQQYGGKIDRFISWKIRNTFRALNKSRLKFAVGAYWKTKGLVVFAVTSGGNTKHDMLLALDVRDVDTIDAEHARWYIWKLPSTLHINAMTQARSDDDDWYIYVGTVEGDVCRLNVETFMDLAVGYNWDFITKHNDFGIPGARKTLGDYYLESQVDATSADYDILIKPIFDYGTREGCAKSFPVSFDAGSVVGTGAVGTAVLGQENRTLFKKEYGVGEGNSIATRFSSTGSNQPWYLIQYAHQVSVEGESEAAG